MQLLTVRGLRNYSKQAEYILYYTFQDETGLTTVMLDTNNFSALRKYFKGLQEYISLNKKEYCQKSDKKQTTVFGGIVLNGILLPQKHIKN